MPTYEYTCKACGEHSEVVQSFKDSPLTECAACGGQLRKVFGNIGITFKGSGFYKTDSRSDGRKASAKSGETKSGEASGTGTGASKSAEATSGSSTSSGSSGSSTKTSESSSKSGSDGGKKSSASVAAAS
jgi:putative FmdB family regulatory protein